MAKPKRPEMQICPSCGGKGFVVRPKLRVDGNGKGRTENVEQPCPQCHYVGFVRR